MAIKLSIDVDDKGTVKVKEFGKQADSTAKKASRAAGKINTAWRGVGKGLTSITKGVFNLKNAIVVLAGSAGIGKLISSTAKMGDQFHKMAQRTGLSVKTLSEMAHVAELSGTSISSLEVGIRRMTRAAFEANQGLATYERAFDEIGVTVTDTSGKMKSQTQIFDETLFALAGLEDKTKQAAIAQQIFGRSGTNLIPILNAGEGGIKAMRQEAERLGISMSSAGAQAAADYTDAMARVKASFVGVRNAIFLPLLTKFADKMNSFAIVISNMATDGTLKAVVNNLSNMANNLKEGFNLKENINLMNSFLKSITGIATVIATPFALLADSFNALKVNFNGAKLLIAETRLLFIKFLKEGTEKLIDFIFMLNKLPQVSIPLDGLMEDFNSLSRAEFKAASEAERLTNKILEQGENLFVTDDIIKSSVETLVMLDNNIIQTGSDINTLNTNMSDLGNTSGATKTDFQKLNEEIKLISGAASRLGGIIKGSLIDQWSRGINVIEAFKERAKAAVLDIAATILSKAAILALVAPFTGGLGGAAVALGGKGTSVLGALLGGVFAQGGMIKKGTTGRSDNVPILASKGEYVMSADAVRSIGKNRLDNMNKTGKIKYADGGIIGGGIGTSRTGENNVNINFNVSTIDAENFTQFMQDKGFGVIETGIRERKLEV